jgi:hypothetical protein
LPTPPLSGVPEENRPHEKLDAVALLLFVEVTRCATIMIKKIRVCPVCKSIDIAPRLGFKLGWEYECKNCGYRGALTEEVDISKIKKME